MIDAGVFVFGCERKEGRLIKSIYSVCSTLTFTVRVYCLTSLSIRLPELLPGC